MLMVRFNKKAFVLMEAIVVIVVISVALLTLFASYNKILGKVRSENKYDLSEYLYKTYYIKQCLMKKSSSIIPYRIGDSSPGTLKNYYGEYEECKKTNEMYNVKNVYIITNINGSNSEENLKNFDAYMIDYIKQLDVDDNASLIIVEYYKHSRNNKYDEVKLYGTISDPIYLSETYIASLEW